MRSGLLGLVLAVAMVTGCATPQPVGDYHYSLLMCVSAKNLTSGSEAGGPAPLMRVDARIVRTIGEVTPGGGGPRTTAADFAEPENAAFALARSEVYTICSPALMLPVAQEGAFAVSSDPVPPYFSVAENRDGSCAVRRVHDDVVSFLATVTDFDEAAGTGHVSVEAVLQTRGKIDAYFTAADRAFKDGEALSLDPTSPAWPEEKPLPPKGKGQGV